MIHIMRLQLHASCLPYMGQLQWYCRRISSQELITPQLDRGGGAEGQTAAALRKGVWKLPQLRGDGLVPQQTEPAVCSKEQDRIIRCSVCQCVSAGA